MASGDEHGTAVITGVASERGIARTLAHRLAAAGWSLGLIDLDAAAPVALAETLTHEHGIAAIGAGADISKPGDVDAAISAFEASLPPIRGLANIAGIADPTPFLELTVERWRRTLDVNATGTFIVTQRVLPGMLGRGYGRIVSMSSTAAQNGGGTYSKAAYSASKAAIEGMTRSVAIEFAAAGVTANVVAPAIIDTDIMGGRIEGERAASFIRGIPVGRLGRTSEVAALIEFLLGEESGYITGATYNVNGGIRIG
jgi:2-hydroxycyclohexanecarboxyl-CoA dehydrogenase